MAVDSLASAGQIRQPVERNVDIDNAFNRITYQKGGGVLVMFESFLGEEAFRKGLQTHLKRYADGVANTDDFIQSMADGSGRPDVVPAFRSFVYQPGLPLVIASLDCSETRSPKLNVRQNRYRILGSPIKGDTKWIIPLGLAYEVEGERHVAHKIISKAQETIALDAASCPSTFTPNANGTGYYRFALDESGWANLASNIDFMNPAETLVYADSLMASFRADETSGRALIAGLRPLAMHSDTEVVGSTADLLEGIRR
jgi:alanyl aminopeptidase